MAVVGDLPPTDTTSIISIWHWKRLGFYRTCFSSLCSCDCKFFWKAQKVLKVQQYNSFCKITPTCSFCQNHQNSTKTSLYIVHSNYKYVIWRKKDLHSLKPKFKASTTAWPCVWQPLPLWWELSFFRSISTAAPHKRYSNWDPRSGENYRTNSFNPQKVPSRLHKVAYWMAIFSFTRYQQVGFVKDQNN